MKKFFRYLICTALVASPMAICAMDRGMDSMDRDGSFYIGGNISGLLATSETATIYTNKKWTDFGDKADAKASISQSLEKDWTFGFAGLAGYRMDSYAFELNLAYTKITPEITSSGTSDEKDFFGMHTVDTFINAAMQIDNDSKFTPLFGLGIGMTSQYIDMADNESAATPPTPNQRNIFKDSATSEEQESDWEFTAAWQVFGGVEYNCMDNIDVFARIGVNGPFTKPKFKRSDASDDPYIQYKPMKVLGSVGVKFSF